MKILQVLSRVFVEDLDKTIPVFETLLQKSCSMRFSIPNTDLELAQVGSVLLYAGKDREEKQSIDISFVADDLSAWKDYWLEHGGCIIQDMWPVAGGRNMVLRHPDETTAEYLELFQGGHPCRD